MKYNTPIKKKLSSDDFEIGSSIKLVEIERSQQLSKIDIDDSYAEQKLKVEAKGGKIMKKHSFDDLPTSLKMFT